MFGLAVVCPGSKALVHASATVSATAHASCADVKAEMLARVQGQGDELWHDPHNNGTYAVTHEAPLSLSLSRLTGDKKYTDMMTVTLAEGPGGTCSIAGCSESQVTSILDFGTNYCNLKMLYCGSADGCKPVSHDFTNTDERVKKSSGAAADMKKCLTV